MSRTPLLVRTLIATSAVLFSASCSGAADDPPDALPAPTSTTVANSTTTASTTTIADPGPLELVGTYDGEDCSFEGPDASSLDVQVSLTLVNDSADAVFLRMLLVPPDQMAAIEPLVGSDFDFSAGRTASLNPTLYAEAGPFEASSALAFLPGPGAYLVECASVEGAAPEHVWWLAVIEVSP